MFVPLTRLRCSKSDPQRGNGNAEFKMRDGRGFMSPRLQSRIPSGEAQQMRGVDPKHCALSRGRPPPLLRSAPPLPSCSCRSEGKSVNHMRVTSEREEGEGGCARSASVRPSVRPTSVFLLLFPHYFLSDPVREKGMREILLKG